MSAVKHWSVCVETRPRLVFRTLYPGSTLRIEWSNATVTEGPIDGEPIGYEYHVVMPRDVAPLRIDVVDGRDKRKRKGRK